MSYRQTKLAGNTAIPYQPRSLTDWLLDALTPLMIFIMVTSVIFFLLDVRFVYTEVHDANLRWVAFSFILGVVALNRLIAREGTQESFLYFVALAGAIGMYTLATTNAYDVGSVASNFMNRPWIATGFNMCIVAFIWWLTNRLTHECCVDDNPLAGDMGILTGTARKFQESLRAKPAEQVSAASKESLWVPKKKAPVISMNVIEAVDPLDYDPNRWKPKGPAAVEAPVRPLPKRHPGISVFYFSIPVMFIFAVGLRVVQNGGEGFVSAGKFYMGLYTVCALALLNLTSLAQLREYFRARKTPIPGMIGVFWIGLGAVMVAVVLFGATALPMPSLPPAAYVQEHQYDPWARGSTFQLNSVAAPAVQIIEETRFMERVGQGVLVVLGLFLAYGALRALGVVAISVARRRDLYPQWVTRLFGALDRFLQRITQLPAMPHLERRRRVSRDVATSVQYRNPMGDPARAGRMTVADNVEFAYSALCALARDLGVPRHDDQTPFEFIRSFPRELDSLRDEAYELTNLYVIAAYSPERLDDRITDRLRKFWLTYERARNRVIV
ncbi:MAG: DUF4129 domain-containing protein [Candidatus Hydrogenedentes bacterium]|nr:DUF4129 domain-containing protein [Candidatus Hydrogenedentota bacterium]